MFKNNASKNRPKNILFSISPIYSFFFFLQQQITDIIIVVSNREDPYFLDLQSSFKDYKNCIIIEIYVFFLYVHRGMACRGMRLIIC